MPRPSKFTTYTKMNAVEVMQKIESVMDWVVELETRLAAAEAKCLQCTVSAKAKAEVKDSK